MPLVPLLMALTLQAPPSDPLNALQGAVSDAIESARPSVVAVTRVGGRVGGETSAVRGRRGGAAEIPRPGMVAADAFGNIDPRPDRPGFPSPNGQFAPEYFALPGDFGSGIVIGPEGQILTAFHVVQGAERIRVRGPGVQFDAEVIAADPRSDLAVIAPRPGSEPNPSLRPLPIGDASGLRAGTFLIALGNPYNAARDGLASASLGILANEARRIEPPLNSAPALKQFFRYQPTLLQLDSKLNLGMSGGAVVNLAGELVGVTTSVASPSGFDAEAGYAIPMDELGRRAALTLLEGREVEYGFIGIGLTPTPNQVGDVRPGTPASDAGLQPGDRIAAVDGHVLIDDESALPLALASVAVGQPVKLKVRREGHEIPLTLVMSKYPVLGEVIATVRPEPWRGLEVDYSSVLAGALQVGDTLGAMQRGSVGIVSVRPGSPSASAGLSDGEIIAKVDGDPVSSPLEFRSRVGKAGNRSVTITVLGPGSAKEVVVAPEGSEPED